MTAADLLHWLGRYGYTVIVGTDVQGRRMAWVPSQDRPPLPAATREILAERRFCLAAILDEHDHARCGTERLKTLAWSRTIWQKVKEDICHH